MNIKTALALVVACVATWLTAARIQARLLFFPTGYLHDGETYHAAVRVGDDVWVRNGLFGRILVPGGANRAAGEILK